MELFFILGNTRSHTVRCWCSAGPHRGPVYSYSALQQVGELSALGFGQQAGPAAAAAAVSRRSLDRGQQRTRRPSHHHSFRACSQHMGTSHTLAGKQPSCAALQVSLLCSCHLFFPKHHGAQKSTHRAKQLLEQRQQYHRNR